ncbi:NifU family protein [Candidatus Marinamargulisbacteria bacterium SCGC AAA071-K20]|nr:NifU family protein [Candidatus Marinamargulisbacteria bacterium SCGC AAA071-K20]
MKKEIELTAMPTPNPNSIKFMVEATFLESGSINFVSKEDAKTSILPKALFEIEGLVGVMVGTNFVSITKTTEAGWENILEEATNLIKEKASLDEPIVDQSLIKKAQDQGQEDNEIVRKIKTILDDEIRPAIAMDGGDCEFISFEDGIVQLQLQGACSSCPSATMTLKMGIESRLKEDIPEVKEVVQVV